MKIYRNHKFFGIISLVDMFVIIILIALCVATYNRFFLYKDQGKEIIKNNAKFEYTIKFKNLSNTTQDMIKVEDKIYDKLSGTNIGEIIDIFVENAKDEFETKDGNIILKEIPNKIDITAKVKANGTYNNGQYLASDLIRILIGENKSIKTKYVEMTGQVIDLKMGE